MKKPDDETPRNSGLYIGSEPLETVHDRSAAKLDDDDDKIGDSGDDDSSDSDTTDSDSTDSDTTDKGDSGDDTRDADGKD